MKSFFNSAIISDLLLWSLLLLALALGCFYFGVGREAPTGQTLRFRFRDANEISRGAIVRMMGTEVGYVHDIELKPDHVDIIVKTNPESLPIPSGSHITILFTGLVGSKSIEIVPPPVPRPPAPGGAPVYEVEDPIRLRDTLRYQINIARALQMGAENFTDFFGKKKPLEELQFNIDQASDAVDTANRHLVKARATLEKSRHMVDQTLSGVGDAVGHFAAFSAESSVLLDSRYLAPASDAALRFARLLMHESQATMLTFSYERKFQRMNKKTLQSLGRAEQTRRKFCDWTSVDSLGRGQDKLAAFNQRMDAISGWRAEDALSGVRNARQVVQSCNRGLRDLNQKL